MAIYGDNDVYANSPVAAYSVGTRDGGIISGGTGDHVTTTRGVNFKWVYVPNNPGSSGFTGGGSWYQDTEGSPIWYYQTMGSGRDRDVVSEIVNGTRTTLDDVFGEWQTYVDAEGSVGNDVLQDFQYTVPRGCWSNLPTGM